MRLKAIQAYLKSKNMPFEYWEDNDSGSPAFERICDISKS